MGKGKKKNTNKQSENTETTEINGEQEIEINEGDNV